MFTWSKLIKPCDPAHKINNIIGIVSCQKLSYLGTTNWFCGYNKTPGDGSLAESFHQEIGVKEMLKK
jgi:hypothetical protein